MANLKPAVDVADATRGVTVEIVSDGRAKKYTRFFSSVTEYMAHVDQPSAHNMQTINNVRNHESSESWHGVKGGAAAVEALTVQGWPEGKARILGAFDTLKLCHAPKSIKRRIKRGDMGDELDIHAVNRGALSTAWTRRVKTAATGGRVIKLVANILDNAGNTSDQLFWRGAAALKLAELLTGAGYAVEIWGGFSVRMHTAASWDVTDVVRVKPVNAPLDLVNLATVLCLSGFARVYGFRGLAHAADESAGQRTDSGIGQALDLDTALRDIPDRYITPRINNAKDAGAWITATIADIEGEIK